RVALRPRPRPQLLVVPRQGGAPRDAPRVRPRPRRRHLRVGVAGRDRPRHAPPPPPRAAHVAAAKAATPPASRCASGHVRSPSSRTFMFTRAPVTPYPKGGGCRPYDNGSADSVPEPCRLRANFVSTRLCDRKGGAARHALPRDREH